jgi:hypothetical protein
LAGRSAPQETIHENNKPNPNIENSSFPYRIVFLPLWAMVEPSGLPILLDVNGSIGTGVNAVRKDAPEADSGAQGGRGS